MLTGKAYRWEPRVLGAVILLAATGLSAVADDTVKTIETPGSATLTMCRSWLFFSSCQTYNHVDVPKKIKLGDSVDLVFGSNTKQVAFPVARIARAGDRCTIYNDPDAAPHDSDRIEVDPCRGATP